MLRLCGAELVEVPAADDGLGVDLERLLAAIDSRTRLVAISHVLFRSAYIVDVEAVCRRAHEVGALVSLDAFHAVGIIPVDVQEIGCDFLTGGVLKWLCGGPGGCFLYVKGGLRQTLEPALTGWQAHARPFAFEGDMDYADNAFRWLGGTPVIPALYAAAEGPKIVRQAGITAIRQKSIRQTQRIIELALAQGLEVRTPRDAAQRGGTVTVAMPDAYEVSRWLVHDNFLVDFRPDAGIRIAPHFYTTDEEVERLMTAIDEALATGDWKRHERGHAVVT